MPWVKLDDQFHHNPTNRRLGPAGRDLFIAGLGYCANGLTDGRIDKEDLPLILAVAQAKPAIVAKLVEAGRWVDHGDHYEVAEYLTYQPSKAKVIADREAARDRQRRARDQSARRHAVTDTVTNGARHTVTHGPPVPSRPPSIDIPGVTPSLVAQGQDQDPSEAVDYATLRIAPEQAEAVRQLRASRFGPPDDAA